MVRSLRIRCHQKKVHVLEQGIQPWRPETFQMTDLLGREVPAQGTAFAAFGFEHQRVKLHPMSSRLAGKSPLPVFQESVQLDVVARMSRPVAGIQYAYDRYSNEAARLYLVLDTRLDGCDFVATNSFTIADMAIFPWCRLHGRQGQSLDDYPNVKRWFNTVAARPAVAKDMSKLEDKADQTKWTEESWSNLFGAAQYRRQESE